MIMNGHLSEEMLMKLKNGRLTKDQKIAALHHIGECDYCAEAFSKCLEEDGLLTVTPDFSSEVKKKIERTATISGRSKNTKQQGKKEFYFYSLKVGVAACIALLLLFTGGMRYGMGGSDSDENQVLNFSKINTITESLRGISDKFADFDESGRLLGGI